MLAGRGKVRLGDVTSADVAEFLAWLREGDADHEPLAVSSAARAVIAVRGLHAFAVAQGLAEVDPAREVAPPSPPKRLPKAIAVTEVERLLDAAGPAPDAQAAAGGVDPRLLRDRALLEFLYATGARISEATQLDVDDLQLDDDPVCSRLTCCSGLAGGSRLAGGAGIAGRTCLAGCSGVTGGAGLAGRPVWPVAPV